MLRNPDRFCKAYQAFQNSLSLWAEKKNSLWAVLDTEFWSQANPEIHEKNKHMNKQFPATYWNPSEGHLIDSFFLWSGYLIFSSSFWILMWAETQSCSCECQFLWQWEFRLGHSRWKDTVWFLKDGRGNEWNRLDLLLELPAYTICPVTERKVTTREKDLAHASVPQILSGFCAGLVLSWDY